MAMSMIYGYVHDLWRLKLQQFHKQCMTHSHSTHIPLFSSIFQLISILSLDCMSEACHVWCLCEGRDFVCSVLEFVV